MPRVTNAEALARRERVAELWVRGVSAVRIAKAAGCDRETVVRDVRLLSKQAAADLELDRERHRLLAGAKAVEAAAWQYHAEATGNDRQLALGRVLAAQAQALAVLGELAGADIERRLSALEAQAPAGPARGAKRWAA